MGGRAAATGWGFAAVLLWSLLALLTVRTVLAEEGLR